MMNEAVLPDLSVESQQYLPTTALSDDRSAQTPKTSATFWLRAGDKAVMEPSSVAPNRGMAPKSGDGVCRAALRRLFCQKEDVHKGAATRLLAFLEKSEMCQVSMAIVSQNAGTERHDEYGRLRFSVSSIIHRTLGRIRNTASRSGPDCSFDQQLSRYRTLPFKQK